MARINFALKMLFSRFNKERSLCPYCSSRAHILLERKKFILQARKCIYCGLVYRWPTDSEEDNLAFYEKNYMYSNGRSTPDLPDNTLIERIMNTGDIPSKLDKSNRIEFLRKNVATEGRLLDFGCSWGISTYQYNRAGYDAIGFEIDKKRAEFGSNKLGIDIKYSWDIFEKNDRYDIILADHSLEHVPILKKVFDYFEKYTVKGSMLVIFVPNCGSKIAREQLVQWGPFIGEAHTIAFTLEWFSKNISLHGFSPVFYDQSNNALDTKKYLYDGEELALVATKR